MINRIVLGFVLLLALAQPANGQYPVTVTVIPIPPIPALLSQAFSMAGTGIRVTVNNNSTGPRDIKLFGRLERKTPSFFAISLSKSASPLPISLAAGQSLALNSSLLERAFGNFSSRNLLFDGASINDLREGGNFKLPEGYYCIYFYARGGSPETDLSDPSPVPVCFYICNKATAPQFTQPVNNLDINSGITILKPVSPIVFSWTPPLASCELQGGRINYDLEIREIFNNQTVTDAIRNPFVFRKTSLPSTTFLLDTNLNRNVLQQGKRYAIRVRAAANNISQSIDIENNGYSRIEVFQYGGSVAPPTRINQPQYYLIPFKERKTDFWDNEYTAYTGGKRNDTLVPIKEYIAFILTQDGIAYNQDAIELFLALNPELNTVKEVKLSYKPRHPVFPKITEIQRQKFDNEYSLNLEPDPVEENKFKKYSDSLKAIINKHDIPDNSENILGDLVNQLNKFDQQVHTVNRVTVNLINTMLSELMYHLRIKKYDQLQSFFSAFQELTTLSPVGTSFIHSIPFPRRSSLSSWQLNAAGSYLNQLSFVDYTGQFNGRDDMGYFVPVILPQILPFDVIVWRQSKELPSRPVLDAPDLTAIYRVFYTVKKLYNPKNPEINAKSTVQLASTAQVALPPNSIFKFWTLNMLNHQLTEAMDVEPKDVFLNSQKKGTDRKKAAIVLKVD